MIGKEEDLAWKKNVHQLNGCASAKLRIGVLHFWNLSGAIFNTWTKRRVGLDSFDFNHLYKEVISQSIRSFLL